MGEEQKIMESVRSTGTPYVRRKLFCIFDASRSSPSAQNISASGACLSVASGEGRNGIVGEERRADIHQALSRDNCSSAVEADEMESGLTDIDAKCSDVHDLLHFAASAIIARGAGGADHPTKYGGLMPSEIK